MDNKKILLKSLNNILELEFAGVVKYTHYAFMVHPSPGPYPFKCCRVAQGSSAIESF